MSLREIREVFVFFLHLATICTRLFAKLTGGPKSGDVTGGVRGLVTFGDKGGGVQNGPKIGEVING